MHSFLGYGSLFMVWVPNYGVGMGLCLEYESLFMAWVMSHPAPPHAIDMG